MIDFTQIRITNMSKHEVVIDFKNIVNKVNLPDENVRYEFECSGGDMNLKKEYNYIKINSTNVFKAVKELISPSISLEKSKTRHTNNFVEISAVGNIKDVKLVMNPIHHIVIKFHHQK